MCNEQKRTMADSCETSKQSPSKVGEVGTQKTRRSYDARFKIQVIEAAEATNNCQAAERYGVTECNVRRWRSQKDLLEMTSSSRRAYRGPQSGRFQEIDTRVREYVAQRGREGNQVSRAEIQAKALEVAKELQIPESEFKASLGWCRRMLRRNGLWLRGRIVPVFIRYVIV